MEGTLTRSVRSVRMPVFAAMALALWARGVSPAAPPAPTEPVAAFASSQVWDGDGGQTITRAGLPMHAVHVFSPRGRRIAFVTKGVRPCVFDAEISPTASMIAYWASSGDNCLTPEVVVADISGRTIERFAGALGHAWSPDGEVRKMASRGRAGFFHRTTRRRMTNLLQHRPDQRRDRHEFDALCVHARQQGFAGGIDEIHFGEVQYGLAAVSGGAGGLPTLFELVNPEPG